MKASEQELARSEAALKVKPMPDAATVGAIARCYTNLGRFDDAATDYMKAIKLDPDRLSQYGTKLTVYSLPRMMQLYELAQIVPVVPSTGKMNECVQKVSEMPTSPPSSNPVPQNQAAPTITTQNNANSSRPAIPEGEVHFTLDQLRKYYAVYTLPDVQYLRTLFNEYLSGSGGTKDEVELLKKFDKNYYHSKFMVTSRTDNVMGGTSIQFMFQDRPDKIFDAWVYPEGASNKFRLRAINVAVSDEEDLRRIRIRYKQCLEDKVHAM